MISRYEQTRYAQALGVNPTAHRDDVIRLLQGGKTSAELFSARQRCFGPSIGQPRSLTDGQVRQIRQLYATGRITQRLLAARFGVSPKTVWDVLHGVNAYASVA